jgi:hypothetical protein
MASPTFIVMVNAYRSSTDSGFCNTWRPVRCASRAEQRRILTEGLPVRDCQLLDNAGNRHPCYSTVGIRTARADERRDAARQLVRRGGEAVPYVN